MSIDLAAAADVTALPHLTRQPAAMSGTLKEQPEDFRVDEIPAYAPSGEGDHLYVRFEKTGLDTREAVRRIARALEVDPKATGFAGMKDRQAVTTQWASFLFGDPARLERAAIEGVRILDTGRHGNKLRTGHLRGNRFDLLLRGGVASRVDDARAQLAELARRGVPNFFGAQRFGWEGRNLVDAARWLIDGGRPPRRPFERKLQVSTLQSALFNELLAERIRAGRFDAVVDGDLMQKVDTGGLFVAESDEETQARLAGFEISATGPMFGAKMRWPEREALELEEAVLARWGLDKDRLRGFARAGAGTRRPYRVTLEDVALVAEDRGVRLRFTLPKGAYATVVVRELLREG